MEHLQKISWIQGLDGLQSLLHWLTGLEHTYIENSFHNQPSQYQLSVLYLLHLIKQLRRDFDAPEANFVCASLGQTKKGATDGGGKILDAMLAVDGGSGKYPEFKGNVAAVYTHPLSKGGSSGGHYGGNAETYMNVGEAMGQAMVKLLEGK